MLEGLPHLPILTHGSFMDERGNIFRLAPKEPRGVPEGGLRALTNGDGGGSIEKVKVLLVTRVSQLYVVSLLATLSTRNCRSTNFSCHTERGSPRYRRGKEALAAGRLWVKQPRSRWLQWMGTIELLRKLVQRPVTSPKPLKMHARFSTSLLIGAKKTTMSSA